MDHTGCTAGYFFILAKHIVYLKFVRETAVLHAFFTFFRKKCIFFLFFLNFALLIFKIWGIVTHRVFAIRQERSHITFGICCENEAAPLKKAQPATTAALRIEWKYDLEFGQIEAHGRSDRIIVDPMPPTPHLIPGNRAVRRPVRVPFPHIPASSRARMPFVFTASQKRSGLCTTNRHSAMPDRPVERPPGQPQQP